MMTNTATPPLLRTWRRWVAFDHCRLLLPQFTFATRADALARLHLLSLDEQAVEPARPGGLVRFGARLWFGAVALRQVAIFFLRYSRYVEAEDGVSRWQQLGDLWHCVWRQNRYARHYYWRKLYLVPFRPLWLENLEHRQLVTLLRRLNRHLPIDEITHKYHFHLCCRRHGLPTPEVLGAWDESGCVLRTTTEPLQADLFLKPASEFGSSGTEPVLWLPQTGRHRLDGKELAWPELLDALSERARAQRRAFVLQPRLRNAPRNAVYGDHDLCNLRIVTGIAPGGAPEALGAFLRLPSRMTTTGYDRTILFAPVDLVTGRLGVGRFREITHGEHRVHPDTKASISGRLLPGWSEMLDLALCAHARIPWMPFVGWDIVDTPQGVMLLEANAYWGGDALQPPGGMTLGETRFPELYLAWFERFHGPVCA